MAIFLFADESKVSFVLLKMCWHSFYHENPPIINYNKVSCNFYLCKCSSEEMLLLEMHKKLIQIT